MVCSCGGRYPDGDEFCPFCKSRNAEYTKSIKSHNPTKPDWDFGGRNFVSCKNCGRTIDDSATNCPICGFSLSETRSLQSEYSYSDQQTQERLANSCANIALACGILGLIFAGPIFGSIAIFQGLKAQRMGFVGGKAAAAIVLGVLSIVFWLFFMFLLFFYVPRFAPHLLPYLHQIFRLS